MILRDADNDFPRIPLRMTTPSLVRRAIAEALGTGLLLATVVGSGIMAERLAGGNVAIALLANALATAAGLAAYILAFGPISGAHFNPAVTLVDAWQGGIRWGDVPAYVVAQLVGAALGAIVANLMFDLPAVTIATKARGGGGAWLAEGVATFGLLATIWGTVRSRPAIVPFAVGAYVAGAIWFTASTSFANPAVTLARTLSDTFTGIRPADTPAFILAQLVGAVLATAVFRWLAPALPSSADDVVVPHER
jgi:glycerol uptake facilitator-like aquaporin